MAITASGLYGLSREKQGRGTLGGDLESETAVKWLLVLDAYTPNFDTHDFRDDITNEHAATGGYSTGGFVATGTELTVGSPAAGQMKYDANDFTIASSTITNAMADVGYIAVGTAATDPVVWLQDFVTAVSTVSGLLTVQHAANGIYYEDFTP
jgi:hypothetical protein